MSNRGRHRKKFKNCQTIKVYDEITNRFITYYIETNKIIRINWDNDKSRKT